MNIWLRIDGSPSRQFFKDADAVPFLDPKKARHELLLDAGTLRATTGSENANISVTLSNTTGKASALFVDPPLGAAATLFNDDAIIFEGTVKGVDLSDTTCTVSIEA